MDKKLIIYGGIGGAFLLYWLSRPQIKILDIDTLSKTVTIKYRKMQFTYKWTDGMKEFINSKNDDGIVFVTNGNVIDIHATKPDGTLRTFKQVTI
jgi:hypothetical protein